MKFCYLLQVVRRVPLGYRFTMYSYGPFDSNVLSDLNTAESLRAVRSSLIYYPGGYGYKIAKGELNDAALQVGRGFLNQFRDDIEWVIGEFGSHGSSELELESSIIFVDREAFKKSERPTVDGLAQHVRDVKPHFAEECIREKASNLAGKGLLRSVANVASAGG